jgi:hypothetical protein
MKASCSCQGHHSIGHSRRDFVRLFGLGSLGLLATRAAWADTLADATGVAKVPYHGAFSELPAGAVRPMGWTKKWLERQADGLSGHPENMAYPYDTCMFAGEIPPNKIHGEVWWPYEQSGYYFDATARLNQLIDNPIVKERHDKTLAYILSHSTAEGFGASK